jgi:hypothetical protein
MKMKTLLFLSLVLALPMISYSQGSNAAKKMSMHHEVPDDNSFLLPLENAKTSAAYSFKSSSIFTTQVNVNQNGQNILGDAANEPSIAVDPTNPDRMMIGWRQFDNVNNNFRQAGYGYTLDGGQTWTFPGVIDPGVFRSDPVLDCDADGNFYYNSLTHAINGDFECTVYKIDDGGVEWDDGTFAYGGDKQWMRIDRTDGVGSGNNYSFWTQYWSAWKPDHFTRSTNGGFSFEPCILVPGIPFWGTLAVGPEGELYVGGAGEYTDFVVSKSTNAQIPGSTITWNSSTPVDLDGTLVGWKPVNPQGLLGQLWLDVDVSDGPGRGNVYVLASVDRNSSTDPGDVMFARSTDGGLNWDPPVRINDDPTTTKYQWFGTMSVAPNGRIDAVWLDTRADPWGTLNSALFYSYSLDQGETWSVNEQLSDIFDPHLGWPQQQKMGDYFHMTSDEGGAHLAWANTLNGEQDVYYSYITAGSVGLGEADSDRDFMTLSNYPNPFRGHTSISYTIGRKMMVRLVIYDVFGKEVLTLLDKEQEAGTHNLNYNASGLQNGVYICRLYAGNKTESLRLVKVGH